MDVVTLGAALNGSKKYTDTVAQSLMGGVRYQGEVDYYADLPSNPEEGDAYTVKYSGTSGTNPDGTEYAWGLNHQTQQYGWIDFSKDSYTKTETNNLLAGKQGVIDSTHKLSADLVDDTNATNKFVTAAEKTSIAVINYNAANHNGIFRGKDLTEVYTIDEMYDMIHSGNFDDLYLGDYFTKSITTDIYTHFTGAEFNSGTTYYEMDGTINDRTWTETSDTVPQSGKTYATKLTKTENVTLMFAAFDYYYNMGDTALTTHHAVLIPKTYFATTAKMNPTSTTVGGYYNSDMHQITLPCYAKSLKTALGNHLLAHKTELTTTVNTSTPSMAGAGMTGASSASAWETTELQLMNEVQLYGTMVWSSSAYEVGVDNEKLPVFNFINPVHYSRISVWLRSVVSSTNFAFCYHSGYASGAGASNASYVRPLILFG